MTKVEVFWSLRESWFASSNRSEIFNENIYLEVLFQKSFRLYGKQNWRKAPAAVCIEVLFLIFSTNLFKVNDRNTRIMCGIWTPEQRYVAIKTPERNGGWVATS